MFGKCRCSETIIPEYRKLLEQTRLQLQDMQEQVLKLQAQWDKERQELVRQLTETALPQLAAIRNPRPQLPPTQPTAARPYFPGFTPDRRPAPPTEKPAGISTMKAPNGS